MRKPSILFFISGITCIFLLIAFMSYILKEHSINTYINELKTKLPTFENKKYDIHESNDNISEEILNKIKDQKKQYNQELLLIQKAISYKIPLIKDENSSKSELKITDNVLSENYPIISFNIKKTDGASYSKIRKIFVISASIKFEYYLRKLQIIVADGKDKQDIIKHIILSSEKLKEIFNLTDIPFIQEVYKSIPVDSYGNMIISNQLLQELPDRIHEANNKFYTEINGDQLEALDAIIQRSEMIPLF